MKKRGVSPVIATVLLIGMVVVLALIVFVWMQALAQETVTKFGTENIELACDDVSIDAGYSASTGNLTITNSGNVPIYQISMKISEVGRHYTEKIKESQGWRKYGLDTGQSFIGSVSLGSAEEVILIPVLLGNSEDGKKRTHTCEERFGFRVI
jgi:flagellin-like protein